jgi:phage gp36-like protein
MTTDALSVSLHPYAAALAAGTGESVDLETDDVRLRSVLDLVLLVTSGTPTLTVQTSVDGTIWATMSTMAGAAGSTRARISGAERYVRCTWSAAGTFQLSGQALQLFASVDDLHAFGVLSNALPGVSADTKLRHLLSATERVRSYLAPHNGPVTTASADVQQVTCQLAAAALLTSCVGVNPESKAHLAVMDAAKQALSWLEGVRDGKMGAGVKDSTATTVEGSGAILSEPLRGWGSEWGTDVS